MTTDTREIIARIIRSAPDSQTVEGSQDLADRVIGAVRALDEQPELEEVRHPPMPMRRSEVDVMHTRRRLTALADEDDDPSLTRRIVEEVLAIIAEEVPLVGRAHTVLQAVREAWEEGR